MARRLPTSTSSTALARRISLFPVDSPEIRPEPDEAERKAILAALAAEESERARQSQVPAWGRALSPARDDDDPEP
jgi:hypothetical protein